jgi:MFS family permease
LGKILDRGAVSSLIVSRAVYAINWYNVATVFAFVAYDFGQNISGLGIITASFYLGVSFQVLGGILAARLGPKKTAIYGMLLMSAAAILTGFTSIFYEFVVLRFFEGVGMALNFGSGVTLVAKYFRRESQGFGVGIFNAVAYVGGILGVFAWSVLAEFAGWRMSLAISGALGVSSAILLFTYVPKDEQKTFAIKLVDLRRVLLDKWLVLLSLQLFGMSSGSILITTFMVFYLEKSLERSVCITSVRNAI